MKKPVLGALAGLLIGLGLAQPAAASIAITFTPDAQWIAASGTVNVDVSISGLDAEILSSMDLNVVWSASVLGTPQSFDFQPGCDALGTGAFCGSDGSAAGNFGFQAFSVFDDDTLAAQQANSFLLGRFSLTGIADGSSLLTFGADPFLDWNFTGLGYQTLDLQVHGACVAVGSGSCNAVPEPGTSGLALLGLAAAGAPGVARRRRQDKHGCASPQA